MCTRAHPCGFAASPLPERGIGCGANSKAPLRRGEVPTGTGGRVRALRILMFRRYAHYRARDMLRGAQRDMRTIVREIWNATRSRYAPYGCEICDLRSRDMERYAFEICDLRSRKTLCDNMHKNHLLLKISCLRKLCVLTKA